MKFDTPNCKENMNSNKTEVRKKISDNTTKFALTCVITYYT